MTRLDVNNPIPPRNAAPLSPACECGATTRRAPLGPAFACGASSDAARSSLLAPRSSPRSAFSLVELLVVISIIVALAAISFPVVGALRSGSQFSSAENAIVASVNVVRAYTQRNRSAAFQDIDDPGDNGDDSGVAVVFTPGGELRLVENDPDAEDGTSQLIEPAAPNAAGQSEKNAYNDIADRDYVKLPSRIGVAGVKRRNSSTWPDGIEFLPAPFAVRFDKNGTLINRLDSTGGTSIFAIDGHVYYDGDADGTYETSSSLPSDYNPAAWDYRSPDSDAELESGSASTTGRSPRWTLPADKLKSVVVVVLYDVGEFTAAGGWDGWQNDAAAQQRISEWLQENGRFIFFSRTTGLQRR